VKQLLSRNLDQRVVVKAQFTLTNEVTQMLWTIFVILLVLWLLGLVSSYTLGGYIHILLVIAVVVLLINLISGRRPAL
jgi:predicted ferric reductase